LCTDKEYELCKNINFIQGSVLNIPLESNTYDLVFSCDMLEHIPKNERFKAMQEAIRVCKRS
jgi:ubiquinone/menaquinone biosynthesis C-methylase UbiE